MYLERGPLKRWLKYTEVIWVAPNLVWLMSLQEEDIWTDSWGNGEKAKLVVCKPSSEISEESKPDGTSILDF